MGLGLSLALVAYSSALQQVDFRPNQKNTAAGCFHAAIYIYIHVHIFLNIYLCKHIFLNIYLCKHIFLNIYFVLIYLYTYILDTYIYTHIFYTHVFIHKYSMQIYSCTYVSKHICMHTFINTHRLF